MGDYVEMAMAQVQVLFMKLPRSKKKKKNSKLFLQFSSEPRLDPTISWI
jgi:hypothetical protein